MVERGIGSSWLISRMGLGLELRATLNYLGKLAKGK